MSVENVPLAANHFMQVVSNAMYPITAILDPYIGTTELVHMPVIANRDVTESENADVEGESFFRFLDELDRVCKS